MILDASWEVGARRVDAATFDLVADLARAEGCEERTDRDDGRIVLHAVGRPEGTARTLLNALALLAPRGLVELRVGRDSDADAATNHAPVDIVEALLTLRGWRDARVACASNVLTAAGVPGEGIAELLAVFLGSSESTSTAIPRGEVIARPWGRASLVDGVPFQRRLHALRARAVPTLARIAGDAVSDALDEACTGARPAAIDRLGEPVTWRRLDDPSRDGTTSAAADGPPSGQPLRAAAATQPDTTSAAPVPDRSRCAVVVAAHDEGRNVFLTVEAVRATAPDARIVVVDDGSSDGCCDFLRARPDLWPEVTLVEGPRTGSAVARNRGVAATDADRIVFLDAHCFPAPGWLDGLLPWLDDPAVGIVTPGIGIAGNPRVRGYGLAITSPVFDVRWLGCPAAACDVPAAGAGCMAMRRETFARLGGFEPMRRYGVEDVELCVRCWLAGHRVVVEPSVAVSHVFKERVSFELPHEDYLYNVLRAATLHFGEAQLARTHRHLAGLPAYPRAVELLAESDVAARRAALDAARARDGAWYAARFTLPL